MPRTLIIILAVRNRNTNMSATAQHRHTVHKTLDVLFLLLVWKYHNECTPRQLTFFVYKLAKECIALPDKTHTLF